MDGISVLREAISTVPIPAAPPRLSRDGATVGLGFLDAALRLNHVRRLTERLTVKQHRIAHRSTEVDISINMLTDTQLEAARMLQALASHSSLSASNEQYSENTLWVPVARLSRTNVGPIEVHDESGRRLPRLTQYETSRLIASGLYRLLRGILASDLRGILASDSDARHADKELGALLFQEHQPRWLIQSAILTVLTEASRPQTAVDATGVQANIDRAISDPHRKKALDLFNTHQHLLADYVQLFDVAVNDYLVVVALDARSDEHQITYESPLYVNKQDRRAAQVWRLVRASRQGYYVSYRTDIPTTLRSYHLVAEADEGVDVSKIFLTTNAHENEVNALANDLRVVAERLAEPRGAADNYGWLRALDLELHTLLYQVSELMRRTRWEASTAGVRAPQRCVDACTKLTAAISEFEKEGQIGQEGNRTLLAHPLVSAEILRRAADEIDDYELRYDISVEAQPTTNRGHVYWRRPPPGPVSSGRTHMRSRMLLRNTAETSKRMVVAYAIVVAGIAYLVACLVAKSWWPYGPSTDDAYSSLMHREAIIALLLLVPGFYYTRLALPVRHSVAGHLRAVPRLVAYLCIASTVGLAAAVAASSVGWITRLAFAMAAAVPVASMLLLVVPAPSQADMPQTLARMDAPQWVTYEEAASTRRLASDAMFSS